MNLYKKLTIIKNSWESKLILNLNYVVSKRLIEANLLKKIEEENLLQLCKDTNGITAKCLSKTCLNKLDGYTIIHQSTWKVKESPGC